MNIIKRTIFSVIVMLNVGFILLAAYLAYDYDHKMLQDAVDITYSLIIIIRLYTKVHVYLINSYSLSINTKRVTYSLIIIIRLYTKVHVYFN